MQLREASYFCNLQKIEKYRNNFSENNDAHLPVIGETDFGIWSEVWGVNMNAIKPIDKLFLWYARSVMRVKSNTSDVVLFHQVSYAINRPYVILCDYVI